MSKAGRRANQAKRTGVPRDWRVDAARHLPPEQSLRPRPALTPAEILHLELVAPEAGRRLLADDWIQERPAVDGLGAWWQRRLDRRLIHSIAVEDDGRLWAHLSVSHPGSRRLPGWEVVRDTFRLVYPDLPGVIVVPAAGEHYTDPLAEVHHVWACVSERLLPDFRREGRV